jgi:hypothetical protein
MTASRPRFTGETCLDAEPSVSRHTGCSSSATQYFNRTHRTVGHLFQGRYHAVVCEKEAYLLTLIRYLHLNPVRGKEVVDRRAARLSVHPARQRELDRLAKIIKI